MKKIVIVFFITLLVSSCSSQPTQYYTLDNITKKTQLSGEGVLVIESIKLSTYLQSKQLHVLENDNKILFSPKHLWAEPLAEAMHRSLASDLEMLEKRPVLKTGESNTACDSLKLRVEKFSPDIDGNVMLSGKWFYYQQSKLLMTNNFDYSEQLVNDGFSASTSLLRDLVGRLADDIVNQSRQYMQQCHANQS